MKTQKILTIFVLSFTLASTQNIRTPLHEILSPVSTQLDFHGVGGDELDNCGYRKDGQCIFCKEGFLLTSEGLCIEATKCLRVNQNYFCDQCSSLLTLQNGHCVDLNCGDQLVSIYGCRNCKEGFILTDFGVCVVPECISFRSGVCIRCSPNLSLINGFCASQNQTVIITTINQTNSSNTSTQTSTNTSTTTTTTTNTTIIITTNGDEAAVPVITITLEGCLTFNSEGSCTQCADDYVLIQRECRRENAPCITYNSSTGQCSRCTSDYILVSNICVLRGAPPYCLNYTNGNCRLCQSGYSLYRGLCVQTDENCRSRENTYGECIGCYERYVLVNGRCSQQLIIPDNNSVTLFNQTNITTIDIQFLQNISMYYCSELNEQGLCIRCFDRFYLRNGLCLRVNHFCKTYGNIGQCLTCFRGYILTEGFCLVDPNYPRNLNCKVFDESEGICSECNDRFYLHSIGFCIQVLPECNGYNSQTGRCTSCFMGFFLANGFCQIVPTSLVVPFCRSYNLVDPRLCKQCVTGYYLDSNRCLPVSLTCQRYDEFSGLCRSCLPSFMLSEGSCLLREAISVLAPFCSEYNRSGVCLRCKTSYQIINFVCIKE